LYEAPAPDCVIPELFRADVVETCAIETRVDPRPLVKKFIEMFEKADHGTDIVRSVTILHLGRYFATALFRNAVDAFGQPHYTAVPTPRSAFVKEWSRNQSLDGRTTTESPVADLFVYNNAKAARKLEVFMWHVQQVDEDDGDAYAPIPLHYAFLLQVVDM
ncbi:hypothetical protein AAVH_21437, partial [Aphelenchoides avenae]